MSNFNKIPDIHTIRKDVNGMDLPSAREIINEFYSKCGEHHQSRRNKLNLNGLMFGQVIVHDIGLRQHVQQQSHGGIQCCSKDYYTILPTAIAHPACAPIQIPIDDDYFGAKNIRCMNYVRSQTVIDNSCKFGSAKQANVVSSFLDLSNIYGISDSICATLRSFSGGQLLMNQNNVFPVRPNCTINCYITGDERTVQTPSLAVLHSLLIREHNRIAMKFQQINPNWNEEKLFEESRRLTIAEYQHIVLNEWLPVLFGRKTLNSQFDDRQQFKAQQLNPDLTTTNEFSSGVFRFMHLLVPEQYLYYNKDGKIIKRISLSDSIGKVEILEDRYDDVIRGLLFQAMNRDGCHEEMMNYLFKNSKGIGIDILSIDVQRGRDHGLGQYFKYRKMCGLSAVRRFNDLYPLISIKVSQNN